MKEGRMEEMATLTPYLQSENAKAQAAFYIEALGGEIVSMQTHGEVPGAKEEWREKVLHMHIAVAGVSIFLSDSVMEPLQPGNNVYLSLSFPSEAETRAAYEKLTAGGVVKYELHRAFWGAWFGEFVDKFGVRWMITSES
jgi:PhnB protein